MRTTRIPKRIAKRKAELESEGYQVPDTPLFRSWLLLDNATSCELQREQVHECMARHLQSISALKEC